MNVFDQVEKNIDKLVEDNVNWSTPVSKEELEQARNGKLVLKFFDKEIPNEWVKDLNTSQKTIQEWQIYTGDDAQRR